MSIIIMILLLGLLILVHELGHFCAARAFGMKVERFGFGLPFGPILYKTKWKDVEIVLHAFLLGGYVSFPDDDKNSDLPLDSEERFANKPIWQRVIVVSAGVIANVICAFALVIFVAIYSGQLPSGNYEIFAGEIDSAQNSSVKDSGLQSGDRILKANGCDINNAYALVTIVRNSAKNNGLASKETIDKNYNLLKGLNPGFEKDEIIPAELSVRLPRHAEYDMITMDKYAAKGIKYFKNDGVKINQNIKTLANELNGKTVYISDGKYTIWDIAQAISDGEHPVILTVLRDGRQINLNPIYPDKNGVIGVGLVSKQTFVKTNTPKTIITESNHYLIENTYSMVYSLGQLFTGNVPMKDLHGVVAITKIGGDMIQKSGKASGILLAALISMNLAILNILPIPALDGGHLLFLLIEKIIGRPLDEKISESISSAFFMLLIIFMIYVIFNDITLLMSK